MGKPILPLASATIRDARRRCGISQAELAARLGVAPFAVAEWEGGKKDPSVSNLWRIVAACGLELRLGAVLPSEQDELQKATDYAELVSGNARRSAEEVKQLVAKYGLRSARASSAPRGSA